MPGWRANLVWIVMVVVAIVVAAWIYVPEFQEGAKLLFRAPPS